jgi:hypothetical protein
MNCGICLGFFSNMADFLVRLNEKDVPGAILPEKVPEDNTVEDLKRWIETRGFTILPPWHKEHIF